VRLPLAQEHVLAEQQIARRDVADWIGEAFVVQ